MVKRFAVQVFSFCLLTACAAFCQVAKPARSAGKVQAKGLKSIPGRSQPQAAPKSLPDAPSAVLFSGDRLQTAGFDRLSQDTFASANPGFVPGTGLGPAIVGPPPAPLDLDKAIPMPKESSQFFEKYLYPALSKENLRYHPSSRDSFMGRATDAASRIFVVRDDSGRQRLNTSYFLGVLTSVAVHTASRPYWARSNSLPLGDFGATFGNDAGMNLLHEFGPGLRQAVTGHMPEFVNKVEQRITRERSPRPGASAASR